MDFKSVKLGDIFSEHSFLRVVKIVGDKAQLVNQNGENIILEKDYFEADLLTSASHNDQNETKSQTELITLIMDNPNTAMTVNFFKKVDEKKVIEEVDKAYQNSTPAEARKKMEEAVKRGMKGEERTMKGYHFGKMNEWGRILFYDLEADKGTNPNHDARLKQFDPRTLTWAIIKGVKYKVK